MRCIGFLIMLLLSQPSANAELYKWIDANGVKHWTNTIAPPEAEVEREIENIPQSRQRSTHDSLSRHQGLQPEVKAPYRAKVAAVIDGDTLHVTYGTGKVKIRLHGIDCPEKDQNYGEAATRFTRTHAKGRWIDVHGVDTDRHGRSTAWVYIDGVCLNEALIKAGLAWHYRRYSADTHLAELEILARQAGIGIWNQPIPIPPWEYRRNR